MAGILTAANISAAASVAGAGASVAGGLKGAQGARAGGEASAQAAQYQAQVARNNATIANQNADAEVQAGQQRTQTQALKGAATGGRIKAAQAANNVDVNTGSAVDVQVSQREQAKLDSETELHNSQLQAYGYRTQATNFNAEAGLKDQQAMYARQGGDISGDAALLATGGTLLSKASSLPFKWSSGDGGLGGNGDTSGSLFSAAPTLGVTGAYG